MTAHASSTLVGPCVRLRPPRPGDTEGRRRIGLHPEVERGHGRVLPAQRLLSGDEAHAWYARLTGAAPHSWVVEASGYLTGWAVLHDVDLDDRRARYEVGLLHPEYLGRGLGTEVTHLVLAHAFGALGLHRVDARTLDTNNRALRVAQRCGFTLEGRARESCHVGGHWQDEVLLGLLEDEYRADAPSWLGMRPASSPRPRPEDADRVSPQAKAK